MEPNDIASNLVDRYFFTKIELQARDMKIKADGIAQGRREAAEAAVALLRSLGPEEEWNEERLCQAILGTASAEKTDKVEI
jgi:hypothetical protein